MKIHERYHLVIAGKRTTVSLDYTLANILSIRLHLEPETRVAHAAIRELLQGYIEEDPGAYVGAISQTLQRKVLLDCIVDKKISKQYWEWLEGNLVAISE